MPQRIQLSRPGIADASQPTAITLDLITLDACPSCKRANVRPRSVVSDQFGTTAGYRCPCGKVWFRDTEADES